MLFWKQV